MINYHHEVEQGSEEWHALRCGIPTASEIRLMITQSLKPASNDKERAYLFELLGQRITGYTEPAYIGDNALRGYDDEIEACIRYSENFAPVDSCGFITNDDHGFVLGYSPDGLVGNDGLIECKSRRQKFQVETILSDAVPEEYMLQIQTGLLVTRRKWLDFVSYSNGLHMPVIRILPDAEWQARFEEAAQAFEAKVQQAVMTYRSALESGARLIPTVRREIQEMY
jgi:hypothetical protein